jgi:hypothetical protein
VSLGNDSPDTTSSALLTLCRALSTMPTTTRSRLPRSDRFEQSPTEYGPRQTTSVIASRFPDCSNCLATSACANLDRRVRRAYGHTASRRQHADPFLQRNAGGRLFHSASELNAFIQQVNGGAVSTVSPSRWSAATRDSTTGSIHSTFAFPGSSTSEKVKARACHRSVQRVQCH